MPHVHLGLVHIIVTFLEVVVVGIAWRIATMRVAASGATNAAAAMALAY